MTCKHCGASVIATFEGPQMWCTGCGRLFWVNNDGSVRHEQVPLVSVSKVAMTDQGIGILREHLTGP